MFEWIKTFLTVYETKNFSLAAEQLYISQPTVSMQIKKLEQAYALTLFERNGKQQVAPTPEAEFLYPKLVATMAEFNQTFEQAAKKEAFKEPCIFACSNTVAMHLLPTIMKQLLQHFPSVDFSIHMMNSKEVVDTITKNQAHLGLIEKPIDSHALKKATIFEDQLVVAGDHDAQFWLMREENSGLRFYNEWYRNDQNIHLPMMEINNAEVLLQFIKQGIGKSIVSKLAVTNEIPWEPLSADFDTRKISLIQNPSIHRPIISEVFNYLCTDLEVKH